jgi:hypothetical protein|tara:strand:+ start:327 stop:569 length:243 start_codon:yes stop_codon:yes gene_type:complete
MASLLIKKFGSVLILTVFFAVTVFWWVDKDFNSDGFTQDDLNEITEKLHGGETRAIRAKRQQALAELKLIERMGKGVGFM